MNNNGRNEIGNTTDLNKFAKEHYEQFCKKKKPAFANEETTALDCPPVLEENPVGKGKMQVITEDDEIKIVDEGNFTGYSNPKPACDDSLRKKALIGFILSVAIVPAVVGLIFSIIAKKKLNEFFAHHSLVDDKMKKARVFANIGFGVGLGVCAQILFNLILTMACVN